VPREVQGQEKKMRRPAKLLIIPALVACLAACGSERASDAPADAATGEALAPAASPAASVPEPSAETATAVPAPPPMAFMQCRACHSVEPSKNGIGPTLYGIVGTKAGDVPGFAFSPALKQSGVTWDRATLDQWLAGPMKMVPGTRMTVSITDPVKRKEVIDYLERLK
jgi:cytochrome c